eukprot:m.196198 g.196198  ORF g.196198 m.196198 type:complete len:305 (+) comp32611_c0_seq1:1602-2516(+)
MACGVVSGVEQMVGSTQSTFSYDLGKPQQTTTTPYSTIATWIRYHSYNNNNNSSNNTTIDDDDDDDEETEDDADDHEYDYGIKEEEEHASEQEEEQGDVMDIESTDNESVVPDISNTSVARRISDVARRTLNRMNKEVDQTKPWATLTDIATKPLSGMKQLPAGINLSNVAQAFSLPSPSTLPTLPTTSRALNKKSMKKSRPNLKVLMRDSSMHIKTEAPTGVYVRPTLTADQLGESWLISPLRLPEVPDNSSGMSPFADGVRRRISLPSDSLRPILHSPTLGLISDVTTPMSSMLSGSLWAQQ